MNKTFQSASDCPDNWPFDDCIVNIQSDTERELAITKHAGLTSWIRSTEDVEIPLRFAMHRIITDGLLDQTLNQTRDENTGKASWMERYQTCTKRYRKAKPEPLFPKAYVTIVNSSTGSLFETLLQIESGYIQSIVEWSRSKDEMDSRPPESPSSLMAPFSRSRQASTTDTERMEARQLAHLVELEAIHDHQKQEYHDFVIKIYEDLRDRQNDVQGTVTKALSFLGRSRSLDVFKPKERSGSSLSLQIPEPLVVITNTDEIKTPMDPEMAQKVSELTDMGFDPHEAAAALEINERNTERAVNMLLENPNLVKAHLRSKVEELPIRKATSLLSLNGGLNSARSSKTNQEKPPASPTNLANNRSFSFTKSLFNKTPEPSNSTSRPANPFNRMGSLFGRAMDAFKVEDSPDMDTELSEAFTIYCGSQIRTMYNLRLQSSNIAQLFAQDCDPAQELSIRMQTCSKLYSNHLSGTIVLIRPEEFSSYYSNKHFELVQRCKVASEFHFDSFKEQLASIESALPKNGQGIILNEGDFFVTRHSNLLSVHVVFHLVWTEFDELKGRSALMTGYRSILQVAHNSNVHHLTIPVCLLPDSQLSNLNPVLIAKRAESVLKHSKGLITEQSRMVKSADKFDRSLVFTLPKSLTNLPFHFDSVREKLTEIFRTS